MKTTITFEVSEEDKDLIRNKSNQLRMGMGTYCRFVVLKSLDLKEENVQNE